MKSKFDLLQHYTRVPIITSVLQIEELETKTT